MGMHLLQVMENSQRKSQPLKWRPRKISLVRNAPHRHKLPQAGLQVLDRVAITVILEAPHDEKESSPK